MCSKTCKEGKQSRTRACDSPKPQYGGKKCDGESGQTQVCNKNIPCPGMFKPQLTRSSSYKHIYLILFREGSVFLLQEVSTLPFPSLQYSFTLIIIKRVKIHWRQGDTALVAYFTEGSSFALSSFLRKLCLLVKCCVLFSIIFSMTIYCYSKVF